MQDRLLIGTAVKAEQGRVSIGDEDSSVGPGLRKGVFQSLSLLPGHVFPCHGPDCRASYSRDVPLLFKLAGTVVKQIFQGTYPLICRKVFSKGFGMQSSCH